MSSTPSGDPPRQGTRVPGLPAYVVALCVAVFLLVLALLSRDGKGDDDPSVGFPLAMALLAVAATSFALVWRTVTSRRR